MSDLSRFVDAQARVYDDALKLRSSMTLFGRAAPDEPLFRDVLTRYFGGEEDPATLERL